MEKYIIIIIAIIIIGFFIYLGYLKINNKKGNKEIATDEMPYQLKDSVLTEKEKEAYKIIKEYCNNHELEVLIKIRLADFITTKRENKSKDFYTWFNKISAKHIDFLIVQKETFRPLMAIEVDDTTHNRKDRQQRDEFINKVYSKVGLPIYHCWNLQKETMITEIENTLKSIIQ